MRRLAAASVIAVCIWCAAAAAASELVHHVSPGDTLESLARHYRTSVDQLVSLNDLTDPNRLHPGQTLLLPASYPAQHVVAPGEYLAAIAKRYGLTVATLVRLNNPSNPDLIRPGQVLKLRASASQTSTPAPRPLAFAWPLQGQVTSRYGPRWGQMHTGIDIAAPTGSPIKAAAAGKVTTAAWLGRYGRTIVVDHGSGFETLYAHLSAYAAKVGATVSQGEIIGRVGSTGNSTGPHLHFEVRQGDKAKNPELFLE
ncbi:MAG: M23 family metallopeptidase [Bacillota bacterium]